MPVPFPPHPVRGRGPRCCPGLPLRYAEDVARRVRGCPAWQGRLGRPLVFHCVPGQPLCGLSRQLLTQVKHRASGAVRFRESKPVWTLVAPLQGVCGDLSAPSRSLASSHLYLFCARTPPGKASRFSEGHSGHALPPFFSTDCTLPNLGEK